MSEKKKAPKKQTQKNVAYDSANPVHKALYEEADGSTDLGGNVRALCHNDTVTPAELIVIIEDGEAYVRLLRTHCRELAEQQKILCKEPFGINPWDEAECLLFKYHRGNHKDQYLLDRDRKKSE